MTTAETAKPKMGRAKKAFLWVVGIFALLIVIGVAAGDDKSPRPAGASDQSVAPAAVAPAARQVTALELARAYEANEVAAQKEYGDQVLEVSGTIAGVELDPFDNPVVKLAAINQFIPVQLSFSKDYTEKTAGLIKGKKFTARCEKVAEVMSMPMVSECSF